MDGVLHKTDSNYVLEIDSTNESGSYIADVRGAFTKKLSLKNCEAIEVGFDLDELAESFAKKHSIYPTAQDDTEYGYKAGFQKRNEILGNQKFTEFQFRMALIDMARYAVTKEMRDNWDNDVQKFHRQRDWFIDKLIEQHSKPKMKWDVTFNLDELDSNGCLILKRK